MLYFLPSYAYHGEGSSKGKIMLLSICMNVNTYFTKNGSFEQFKCLN